MSEKTARKRKEPNKGPEKKGAPVDLEQYGIYEWKGRKYESISYVFALVYNVTMKEVNQYLAKYGLNATKYDMLFALKNQNGGKGLSQVRLATHLIVTPGNITKMLDSLANAGYVTRVVNPTSRRENIIKITPKGLDFIEEVWPGYDKLIYDIFKHLPEEYHDLMGVALKQWLNNLLDRK